MTVVTFSSHYGAMLTRKVLGNGCTLRPVPRFLSSSCGTCAVIEGHSFHEIRHAAGEYLEAVYNETEGRYEKIYEYGQADKSCENQRMRCKTSAKGSSPGN